MRIEPTLTKKYRKNHDEEAFLKRFNDILSSYQEADYRDLPETLPTLHIVGVPRSGTTLLSQLFAAHTDVGFINHLIASFWRAPVYGIRLSEKLLNPEHHSSYQSDFGRTRDIREPHEFGYFWSLMLNYRNFQEQDAAFEKQIDWDNLGLVLKNMVDAFGRPIVFKSFLLGWHMLRMQQALPKTCWIRIRRDPVQNALSILHLRQETLGSKHAWASLRPKEHNWLSTEPYWRQAAGQVLFLEKTHSIQLAQLPPNAILDLSYKELCSDPASILQKSLDMLNEKGAEVSITSTPPASFEYHRRAAENEADALLIEKALKEIKTGWDSD